jgi:hypothetical protein
MLKSDSIFPLFGLFLLTPIASADDIIHDGEFKYLKKQYGEKWAKEGEKK